MTGYYGFPSKEEYQKYYSDPALYAWEIPAMQQYSKEADEERKAQVNPTGNSSFSTSVPNLQIAWDSTSMGTLMECPRKYQYSIIEGWQPREMSVHLTFGLLYHAALELYDRCKFNGQAHEEALRSAVRYALTETWNPELKRGWISDHNIKNRLTLLRSIVWYLETFQDDPLATIPLSNGQPAVELSFRFETDYTSPDGAKFIICGHLDRVADLAGDTWIADRKTTAYAIDESYFEKFSPDNQMSTYDFAGKVIYQFPVKGIIIDAAQVLVTFTRFKRGFVPRTESQQDEWYALQGYYYQMASRYAMEGHWPMNLKACGFYGGCPFRPICGKPPEVRDMWLKAKYVKRVWDPLQVRGDI